MATKTVGPSLGSGSSGAADSKLKITIKAKKRKPPKPVKFKGQPSDYGSSPS